MAKPSAWGSQQPQPQPPPTPPFVGGEQCPKKGHYGQKPVKIGCTSANRKLLSFAFGLHDFSTPTQGPSPLQGKGCNRSHPLARSLRYPRPIRESRGDSLRNRVAIVCVRSAHFNAKSHPILVLAGIVYEGFAQVAPTLLYDSNELGNAQNEVPNNNINTETQRYRVFIFLRVSVPLCCIYIW